MAKRSISSVKKSCDKYWSLIIRSLGRCEKCGTSQNLQAAHFITRANHAVRWDLDNGVCLCAKHHLYWAHLEIQEFCNWFEYKYPTRYERLMKDKNDYAKRTLQDYLELEEKLKKELERLT